MLKCLFPCCQGNNGKDGEPGPPGSDGGPVSGQTGVNLLLHMHFDNSFDLFFAY